MESFILQNDEWKGGTSLLIVSINVLLGFSLLKPLVFFLFLFYRTEHNQTKSMRPTHPHLAPHPSPLGLTTTSSPHLQHHRPGDYESETPGGGFSPLRLLFMVFFQDCFQLFAASRRSASFWQKQRNDRWSSIHPSIHPSVHPAANMFEINFHRRLLKVSRP